MCFAEEACIDFQTGTVSGDAAGSAWRSSEGWLAKP
jgi:hypothetical protein